MQETPTGIRLRIQVVPGADATSFPAGFDPWRRRILARVAAAAKEGEANAELVRAAADWAGVPLDAVRIRAGARNRQKTVEIRGLTCESAASRTLDRSIADASGGRA